MKMNLYKGRIAMFCIVSTLILAFSSAPPAGRTGAPGDGLCTNCHGSTASFDGNVTISGIPNNPVPNTTYTIRVDIDVTTGSPVRGGFQLVALDNTNDNPAGTLSNPDGNTGISMGSGRQYMGHSPAQNFGGGNNISYEADWTAPNINDDITFYVASILGNGSGSNGDRLLTTTETFTIVGSTPIVLDFNSEDALCFGSGDGSAEVIASGGTPPYEYDWSTGDDTPMIFNLTADIYTVTVTDDSGTTEIGTVQVDEPNEIDIDPVIINVSCNGEADGEVSLNPFGGTGSNYDCDWGFDNQCTQIDLEADFYFVTITDENNCVVVREVEVEEPEQIIITITTVDADLGDNGEITAMVSGGTPPYNFDWSDGTNEDDLFESTISNLIPDTYDVLITDDNGCQASADASIMGSMCTISATPIFNNIECAGTNTGAIQLVLDGVQNTPTFLWSDQSTGQTIVNAPAGTYSVTVTDGPCVQILDNLMIEEPDSLIVTTLVLVNTACQTAANGRITIGINGGVGNYDVVWSHGPTNDTIINGNDMIINLPDTLVGLAPGTYNYSVTDGNLCEVTDSIVIRNGDILPPFLNLQQADVILDENGNAPAIGFDQVDAGTFDNCEIDQIIFDSGTFTCDDIGIRRVPVTAIDGNGNSTTDTVSIIVFELTPPTIDCSQSSVVTNSCEAVFYSVPLATDNCGGLTVQLEDGLASGSVFEPGVSTVSYSAIDDCNNRTDCEFTITVNSDLESNALAVDASCVGNDGSIEIQASGGTPPYTILPFENATGLVAGNYLFTINDSAGCMIEQTVTIQELDSGITSSITTTDVLCFGEATGAASVIPAGGSGDFTITGEVENLVAGSYLVTITDIAGCSIVDSFVINQPEGLSSNFEFEQDLCVPNTLSSQDLTIVGGTPPYDAEAIVGNNLITINISDANNCAISETIALLEVVPIELNVTDILVDDGSASGGATVNSVGGTEPLTITWTDDTGAVVGNEAILAGVVAGEYTATIEDANGCTSLIIVVIDLQTATTDLDSNNTIANVYPSPAYDIINIDFVEVLPDYINIMDTNGRLVQNIKQVNQSTKVEVRDMSSGVYLMHLIYEDKAYVKTFVKL